MPSVDITSRSPGRIETTCAGLISGDPHAARRHDAQRARIDAQVSELQALLKSDLPDHNLVLDLKEVKLVDRDAVRFLAEIEAEGAKLRNCSAFVREWISRERSGMRNTKVKKGNGTGE